MSAPKNPEIVIIKNKMYPNGLTEKHIWDYYQKYKGVILQNTQGRDLMFAIMSYLNNPILKRKGSSTEYLQLNLKNYDTILTGRTVAIYSTMRGYEDFGIVDIDTDDWNKALSTTRILYDIMTNSGFTTSIKILYTGKNSFHLHCKFINKLPINRIKALLSEHIRTKLNPNFFTLFHKRMPNKPNIDLSPNKFKGAYITEGSLSVWGLKCMEVPISKLSSFKQWNAKI